MWNAIGNGSGLHGAGGGYVSKAQGWEFVPCSKLEKGRGRDKSRSPLRTLSVSSVGQFYEQPLLGLPATPEASARAHVTRHELQTQNSRLKKKFEDLKKRHEQDKEGWMREKEFLLRQVADIQGGESRRILLDLKSVLEGVQLDIKNEETKRNELQLQYTKDRCAWQMEREELQRRISQLEAKESSVGTELGIQDSQRWRDREEQRRLLSDTHTAAMALRCHLERTEHGWAQHKSDMLKSFDAERREWEAQLRSMQRKVEQLCDEVKNRQEKTEAGLTGKSLRLSLLSSVDESSVLTDLNSTNSNGSCEPADQNSNTLREQPDGNSDRPRGPYGYHSNGFTVVCRDSDSRRDSYAAELEDILQGCHHHTFAQISPSEHQACISPFSKTRAALSVPSPKIRSASRSPSPKTHSLSRNPSPKTCALQSSPFSTHKACSSPSPATHQAFNSCPAAVSHAAVSPLCSPRTFGVFSENGESVDMNSLNDALKEIAKASEELCSYQNEIRRNAERKGSFSILQLEEEEHLKEQGNNGVTISTDVPWSDLQFLEEKKWTNLEDAARDVQARAPMKNREAPPVPPRTTSWYLQSFAAPRPEVPGPHTDSRQGSNVHAHWKSNSPSILRKFGAMLQENEGKTLTDSGSFTNLVPADSKCNIGCCHSQWSCHGSKLGSSKSSTYLPVQKCTSEPEKEVVSRQFDGSEWFREQLKDGDFLKVHLRSSHLPPSYSKPKSAWKNETLEKKTAEFNHTVFQTEAGYDVIEDSVPPAYVSRHPGNQSSSSVGKCCQQALETKPKTLSLGSPTNLLERRKEPSPFNEFTKTKVQQAGEARVGSHSCPVREAANIWSHVLNEQPWRPGTLAAYPRPADSRSNYGAIERILQSYNSSTEQYQPLRPHSGKEEDLFQLLDMLEMEQPSSSSQKLSQTTLHCTAAPRSTACTLQENGSSCLSMKKSFSRPARPANQRPPSRWASHYPPAVGCKIFPQRKTLSTSY